MLASKEPGPGFKLERRPGAPELQGQAQFNLSSRRPGSPSAKSLSCRAESESASEPGRCQWPGP